jgi:phosphoglycerate dehydrogenase-like enzyme
MKIMATKKVLIATELADAQKALVRERLSGLAEVLFLDEMPPGTLEKEAGSVHVVLRYGGYKPFDDKMFIRMERLELVQLLCAGTDPIRRTPTIPERVDARGAVGANSAAVAEHAFALMLAAAKRLRERDAKMREGVFDQREPTACLTESTVGIIGLGSIGTEFARRASAFGMRILGINRRRACSIPIDFVGTLDDLDFVLTESDFVVLVLPLTEETRHVIAADGLQRMKEDACLVNVGRGGLVVQDDLFEHLRTHPRFTACLDVWWNYPSLNEEIWYFQDHPYKKPFHELNNVLMTPHCAALSGNYRARMLRTALDEIVAHLQTERKAK